MKPAKLYIVIILLILTGCDIFSTREPEEPNNARSGNLPATTPTQLFENLRLALNDKAVDNYMRLFADEFSMEKTYTFIPSASSIAKYPSLSQWELNSEKLYFNNVVVATVEGAPILLTQSLRNNITGVDSAIYQFDYTLTVPFTDGNASETYKGRAEYIINLNINNEWVITSWEDIEQVDFPSWSDLKGSFN